MADRECELVASCMQIRLNFGRAAYQLGARLIRSRAAFYIPPNPCSNLPERRVFAVRGV